MTLPRLRPLEILRLPEPEGEASIVLRDPEGYSDAELVLSEAALFVAAHFDGEHTLDQTLDAFASRFGTRPEPERVEELRARLDEAFFLETDAFVDRRRELAGAFLAAESRAASHAGVSYPKAPQAAQTEVTGFFETARSLEEPGERPGGALRGLVAPHIDLRFGGPCSALAYRAIAESPAVDTVIVLGTAHACPFPAWIPIDKPFETPLGPVPVDEEACSRLAAAADPPAEALFYHRREHSVEFQALFLAALRKTGRDIRMAPVLCGSLREQAPDGDDAFLRELRDLLAERGERAVVVAGADLAHVGPRFGDAEPLGERHRRLLEAKDRATLETVIQGNGPGFHASVMDAGDPRRICGLSPIYGLLQVLPGARGKVLRYEQANDDSGTVSYASVGLWSAV